MAEADYKDRSREADYEYHYHYENRKPYWPEWGRTITTVVSCLIAIVAFLWLFSGCVHDDDDPVAVERVLLVYLAGDNNLWDEAKAKLDAISRGFDGAPCRRVLAYLDSKDTPPSLIELSGLNQQTIIESYDTQNSADARIFRGVIAKAKSLHPGAKFNLLVFSHASGWLPKATYASPKSILVDGSDEMELADFAAAIPDNTFESIVFETCYMAGVEVFYELRHKAKYIAGSSAEIVSPGFTPLYSTAAINELVKGNTQSFMQSAFDHFDSLTGAYHSATLSIVETSGLEDLAAFVKANCDLDKTTALDINTIQHFDRGNRRLFPDFEDTYSRLLDTEDHIQRKQEQLKQLIDKAVTWKAATPYFMDGSNGFVITIHSGLTTYIPQGRYSLVLNPAYRELSWYQAVNKSQQ